MTTGLFTVYYDATIINNVVISSPRRSIGTFADDLLFLDHGHKELGLDCIKHTITLKFPLELILLEKLIPRDLN